MPPSAGACHTTSACESPDCGRATEMSSIITATTWRAATSSVTGAPVSGAGTRTGRGFGRRRGHRRRRGRWRGGRRGRRRVPGLAGDAGPGVGPAADDGATATGSDVAGWLGRPTSAHAATPMASASAPITARTRRIMRAPGSTWSASCRSPSRQGVARRPGRHAAVRSGGSIRQARVTGRSGRPAVGARRLGALRSHDLPRRSQRSAMSDETPRSKKRNRTTPSAGGRAAGDRRGEAVAEAESPRSRPPSRGRCRGRPPKPAARPDAIADLGADAAEAVPEPGACSSSPDLAEPSGRTRLAEARAPVDASTIRVERGGIDALTAGTVEVRMGGIGALEAEEVLVQWGGVGAARAERVGVEFGSVGAALAGELHVTPGVRRQRDRARGHRGPGRRPHPDRPAGHRDPAHRRAGDDRRQGGG